MTLTPETISLADRRFVTDRYGTIEALRAQCFHARTPEGHVIFLDQEDVMEVFRCERFRFTFNLIDADRSPYLAQAIEHELLNLHGAAHARLSALVKRALRERVIDGLAEQIDAIVARLIDALPAEGAFDVCEAIADPLPARVLGPMFDVPYEDTAELNEWIRVGGRKLDALQSGVGIDVVEGANRALHGYLRTLIQARRTAAGPDLFSELVRADIDGDRMSEDELVFLSAELAAAGVDTTRAQLPLIVNALLDHPQQWQALCETPELALRAVDEGMRFAPLPWVIPHSATDAFDYKGIAFESGDLVFCMVPAANRDPRVVPNPDRFDIRRDRVRHFGFGFGMHACPGLRLARMEMASALTALATRCPTLQRSGPPEWAEGQVDRTLTALPVRTA
ncbi:MAG: cytochrome P450 [Pseudomonadota bacterium]